jgi:hypothetical protein
MRVPFENKMYGKLPRHHIDWEWARYDLENTPPTDYRDDLFRVEVE